jgi:hypothetical protein
MSDGARKEVADSTDSAAYFGPMSEAKQNHEAMLQLTDTFEPEQNIAFGSRRIAKKTGKVGPHYFAAVSKREVWSWIPELWRYEMARSETLFWMIQPLRPDLYKNGELPTEGNGFRPQWFPARSGSVAAFANVAIDLDVGRPNLPTSGAAIGLMADAVQAGRIPAPTFMAHSGRGAYAIWQLRQTVPNTPANRTRWRAILLKLVSLTDTLGLAPDGNATKQAQWLKVPGTLGHQNTESSVVPALHAERGRAVAILSRRVRDGIRAFTSARRASDSARRASDSASARPDQAHTAPQCASRWVCSLGANNRDSGSI